MTTVRVNIISARYYSDQGYVQVITLDSIDPILKAGIDEKMLYRSSVTNDYSSYHVSVPSRQLIESGPSLICLTIGKNVFFEYIGPIVEDTVEERLTRVEKELEEAKETVRRLSSLVGLSQTI